MRRVFWLALGATAGVLVVRKISKTAQSYTPAGLARSASDVGDSLRYFADQVRAGMADREAELRDALGLDHDGHDLPPEAAAETIDHPTRPRRSAP